MLASETAVWGTVDATRGPAVEDRRERFFGPGFELEPHPALDAVFALAFDGDDRIP